jgi:peptidoglycan hydrolase CwlO-like protein
LSFQFSVGDRFFGTGRLFLVHPTDALAIFSGNDIGGGSPTEFFANATGFDYSATAAYFNDLIFADQITINELEPTITSFSPTLGAAGSSVTLVGTNLKGVTGLSIFSGATESSPIANTSFASQTSTQISFTAPSFSEASGQIKLRTNSYEVNSTDYFRYAQDPAGGAISPETGQAGDTITVTASAGLNDTQELRLVTVDNLTVTGQFTIIDDTQLTFIIPSEGRLPAPQVVDVQTYNGVSSTSNGSLTVRENSKDIFGDVDISGNLSVSGYVGIGTSSPSAKLHVVGDITGQAISGTSISAPEITNLQTATGTLRADIDSNDTDISALQTATGVLRGDIDSNDTDISALQAATGVLRGDIDSNDTDISALQAATGVLRGDIDSNDTDISALQTATGVLRGDIDSNDTDISALQTATGVLRGDIDSNDTDISALQAATGVLRGDIDSNDTDISALQTATGVLRGDIDSNDTDISALQTATGVLRGDIDSNDTDISALQAATGVLRGDIDSNDTDISALQTATGVLSQVSVTGSSSIHAPDLTGVGNVTVTLDGSTVKISGVSAGGGTPAGSDNQIQFNNGGVFGASSNLTWDDNGLLRVLGQISGSGVSGSKLVINAAGLDGSSDAIVVKDSLGVERFVVNDAGRVTLTVPSGGQNGWLDESDGYPLNILTSTDTESFSPVLYAGNDFHGISDLRIYCSGFNPYIRGGQQLYLGTTYGDVFSLTKNSTDTGTSSITVDAGYGTTNEGRFDLGGQTILGKSGYRLYAPRGIWADQHTSFPHQAISFNGFATDQGVELHGYGWRKMLVLNASASAPEVIVNENGYDVDFRVEATGQANALFVRGSDGNVGIGTSSPSAKLHVVGDITGQAISGTSFHGSHFVSAPYSIGATNGAITIDFNNGSAQYATLNGDVTSFAASNVAAGESVAVQFTTTSTRTIAGGSTLAFIGEHPTSLSANMTGILSLMSFDGSTVVAGFAVQTGIA